MNEPQFMINKLQRTHGGNLPTSVVQEVRARLLQRGFVLLPSDTCYSLGTLAIDESARNNVNAILGRKDEPISLAFSSYLQVQQFVKMDNPTAVLLERYTPGPITIVCKAKDDVPREFLERTIGSVDRTIGVRIPDSRVERDVAGCTQYQLMTVAVRDFETGEAIQDFGRAIDIVKLGIVKHGSCGWAAIEGNNFYASHSTVVRVGGSEKVELLREGDTPFADIRDGINTLSGWAAEDLDVKLGGD
jgi:L-threonylcarbamoyladenylate synthase